MGSRNKQVKADRLLVVRCRTRTLVRFQRCKDLAAALDGQTTGDAVLNSALDLLARRLRYRLGQAGVPLPEHDRHDAVSEPCPEFKGVRHSRTPHVDI